MYNTINKEIDVFLLSTVCCLFVHATMCVRYVPYSPNVFDHGFYDGNIGRKDIGKIYFVMYIIKIHISVGGTMVKTVVFVIKHFTHITSLSHGTLKILAAFQHSKS